MTPYDFDDDEALMADPRETLAPSPLTEFLLTRIGEDWADACGMSVDGVRVAYAFPDRRALAECEAKRRIVELHQGVAHRDDEDDCDELRSLASVYSDHEDYREEWRA